MRSAGAKNRTLTRICRAEPYDLRADTVQKDSVVNFEEIIIRIDCKSGKRRTINKSNMIDHLEVYTDIDGLKILRGFKRLWSDIYDAVRHRKRSISLTRGICDQQCLILGIEIAVQG